MAFALAGATAPGITKVGHLVACGKQERQNGNNGQVFAKNRQNGGVPT